MADDTIVVMLKKELASVDPNEAWDHERRRTYREHLLEMIDSRERDIEAKHHRSEQRALMMRVFERLMWVFGYVVLTQLGISVPIPGFG